MEKKKQAAVCGGLACGNVAVHIKCIRRAKRRKRIRSDRINMEIGGSTDQDRNEQRHFPHRGLRAGHHAVRKAGTAVLRCRRSWWKKASA